MRDRRTTLVYHMTIMHGEITLDRLAKPLSDSQWFRVEYQDSDREFFDIQLPKKLMQGDTLRISYGTYDGPKRLLTD